MNTCPAGHILNEENGYVRTKTRAGKVECRACNRENRPLSLDQIIWPNLQYQKGMSQGERLPRGLIPMYQPARDEVVELADKALSLLKPTEQEVVTYWMHGIPFDVQSEWLGRTERQLRDCKDYAIRKLRKKLCNV